MVDGVYSWGTVQVVTVPTVSPLGSCNVNLIHARDAIGGTDSGKPTNEDAFMQAPHIVNENRSPSRLLGQVPSRASSAEKTGGTRKLGEDTLGRRIGNAGEYLASSSKAPPRAAAGNPSHTARGGGTAWPIPHKAIHPVPTFMGEASTSSTLELLLQYAHPIHSLSAALGMAVAHDTSVQVPQAAFCSVCTSAAAFEMAIPADNRVPVSTAAGDTSRRKSPPTSSLAAGFNSIPGRKKPLPNSPSDDVEGEADAEAEGTSGDDQEGNTGSRTHWHEWKVLHLTEVREKAELQRQSRSGRQKTKENDKLMWEK
ncbi:hypothetical protein R1sor_025607 [Riccia sorocarpa]|uniref:Uncharacterized protein n=1 Tax=Riccia sorocarpa TaxID=122646 RepID=A0ABD3GB44_9MARC